MPQFTIPCLVINQRHSAATPDFALFAAPAGEIDQWAAIKRRNEVVAGTQRPLNKAKLNALKRFLEKDEHNTIPPSITVTLRVDAAHRQTLDAARHFDLLTLDVPDNATDEQKPGLIIDGQHRLFGIKAFDPTYLVNVVALLNVNDLETAFQFLVINNKVTPVRPDLIRTLALDYQDNELAQRLKTARLTLHENLPLVGIVDTDDDSPFRGIVALVAVGEPPDQRYVPPAAIENALDMIQRKEVRELESNDALCEFFYAIWSPLKQDGWVGLWNKESKLMTKAGIVAMTSFVADALIAKYDFAGDLDVSDPVRVRQEVQNILQFQTPEFWAREWTIKISDAAAVRDKIIDSLTRVYRNMRSDKSWHEDVDLIIL